MLRLYRYFLLYNIRSFFKLLLTLIKKTRAHSPLNLRFFLPKLLFSLSLLLKTSVQLFRKRGLTLFIGTILIHMLLHALSMVHHPAFLTEDYLLLIHFLKLSTKLHPILEQVIRVKDRITYANPLEFRKQLSLALDPSLYILLQN